jgi:hypothetical protein
MLFLNKEISMEITTTHENLVEKLNAQILKNVEAQLSTQDLTDEEKAANLVLAKRAALKDAEAITNLVVQALA